MVRIELTCNQLLFQLLIRQRRYIPIMLLLLDLNQWPLGCKPSILTTELRSIDRVVSLTSNYPKEGPSKSSTLWKHENIVWTLWDLNSSETLQMSCADLITLQSPFKYGYLDSNQGQLAPKASILPTELHPYIVERWGPDPQAFYCSICFQDSSQSHWVTSPLPAYLCRTGL